MDKRVLRERMRRKQQQLRRRRMMKRVTCVIAAVLLLIFVVRGVILPIANRVGGGSNKEAETVNVQANASGASSDNSTGMTLHRQIQLIHLNHHRTTAVQMLQ